jgi:hypothetical protein
VPANPAALKQYLNRGGQGTRVEIHPVDQTMVDAPRRRDSLRVRKLQVRYIWDAAVDALIDGNLGALEDVWDDVIAEFDSDWAPTATSPTSASEPGDQPGRPSSVPRGRSPKSTLILMSAGRTCIAPRT